MEDSKDILAWEALQSYLTMLKTEFTYRMAFFIGSAFRDFVTTRTDVEDRFELLSASPLLDDCEKWIFHDMEETA
jgi:hypothetical protein